MTSSTHEQPSPSARAVGSPQESRRTGRIVVGALLVWVALVLATLFILGIAFTFGPSQEHPPRDEDRVIAPGEMVDRTPVLAGRSVAVHGTVEGDTLISAQRVTITGAIHGNLNVIADEVDIDVSGYVEGALHCLCRDVSIGGLVGENGYVFGERVVLESSGDVHRDAVFVGSDVQVFGNVGRDTYAFARELELSGWLGRHLRGMVGVATIASGTIVSGDVELRVSDVQMVRIESDAIIGGETLLHEDAQLGGSKYEDPTFYIAQVLQLFGAFIVGLLALRWFPSLMAVRVGGAGAMLRSMGIGLLLLLVVPVVSVFSMMTLVGFPIGVILAGAYALALYIAGIVVAGHLGRGLLASEKHNLPLALFLGLCVVVVATELPVVGGVMAGVVIVLGLGIMFRAIEARQPSWWTRGDS